MISQSLATRTSDFLHHYPPYAYIPKENLRTLAESIRMKFFAENEFIFQEGEENEGVVFVLQKGRVEIFKEYEEDTRLIDVCDVGDTFGVRSVLSGSPYVSSAKVSEEALLYLIPAEEFKATLSKFPEVAMFFASGLAAGMSIIREQGKKMNRARIELGESRSASVLFREEDVIVLKHKGEVAFIKPENTIKDAADIMTEMGIGSLVVANDELLPVGIVTNVDFTRKIGNGLFGINAPITKIMSRPVLTVPQGETMAEIILTMMKHNVRHLVVTEDGTPQTRFVGIITEHDVLLSQGNNPAVLIKRIRHAKNQEKLRQIRDRAAQLIYSYLEQEISIFFITQVMTEINDALIKKAVELSLRKMDEAGEIRPKEAFCFMSLGSEGRGEQLLRTDQDNAIIYEDPPEEMKEEVAAYFLKLGTHITDVIEACGFAHCKGEIMASNPKWNVSLSVWKAHFRDWMYTPDPEALLNSSIFFDFRGAFGKISLVEELTSYLHESMDTARGFINFFAANAVKNPPPLSFFRNFIVERGGKNKDEFDIKARGMMPITDAARVLILSYKVPEITHTMKRLEKLAELEPQNAEVYQEAAMAYGLMIRYRALHGFRNRNSGRFIHPDSLNKIEKQTLKYAFRTIESLQSILKTRFNLNVFLS
ncbi:MAG: DUF294 nucleotidyltransferase-like domain-containing protein [Bacteroidia bacterium]|nr:DUF294 nucleotidyltransferase-like domain-containing protein [Bacteroidia bacterium]